jgi:small subunit ribosomal protein S21|tara:strand:+ start:2247 stop:2660 length:414 start_codon:yes stop_codon:yes gene_type:complete
LNTKYNSDFKKTWSHDNKKKKDFTKKFEQKDKFDPSIDVRNGNVEQAIRALKKRMLKADRQKELAKREFYEKPTAERKRKKNAGVKKHEKEMRDKILRGEMIPAAKSGLKHLKGKRQINKYKAQKRLTSQRDINRLK